MAKLEDAIVSLAKTPADSGDKLLYISNYSAPIKETEIFKNKVVALKNALQEKDVFVTQLERLINKFEQYLYAHSKDKDIAKTEELLKRIKLLNIDEFLVSCIYPYVNSEQDSDKYQVISEEIQKVLTAKFGISSPYIFSTNWKRRSVRILNALVHQKEMFALRANDVALRQ